jgi:hypothetical protein
MSAAIVTTTTDITTTEAAAPARLRRTGHGSRVFIVNATPRPDTGDKVRVEMAVQ